MELDNSYNQWIIISLLNDTFMKDMKKKLEKIINHITENSINCECELCAYQENGTYLEGLVKALSLIKK